MKEKSPWIAVATLALALMVYIGHRDQRIARIETKVGELSGEYRESRRAFESTAKRLDRLSETLGRLAESLARLEGRESEKD